MSNADEPPQLPGGYPPPGGYPSSGAYPPPGAYPPGGYYPPPGAWAPPPLRFKSLTGLAVALQILLAAQVLVSIAGVWSGFDQRSLIDRARTAPGAVTRSEATQSDNIATSLSAVQIVLYVATGVVWIVWLYRTRRNTELWDGPFQRWGAGWTIGAWFIPLFNLIGPTLVTRDIADATDDDGISGRRWGQPVVSWWGLTWAVMLLASGIDRLENRGLTDDPYLTFDDIDTVLVWDVITDVSVLVAALMAIALVRSLTRRQTERLVSAPAG